MKTFSVEWIEHVRNQCYVEIEAESAEEALAKWRHGEYGDTDRDEMSNRFEHPDIRDVKEAKGEG